MAWGHASFPNAILHIDADAFFASCEQAVNPALKAKPVITGRERGIVAAASYEAKAFGIKRGVRLSEARKLCPDVIIVPSNYETYSLFSKRMFEIIRRFTSDVEEYSIDEAFADITGLRRSQNMSYPKIAAAIQETINRELDLPVSIGLSSTKVLAKLGSKWNKPYGLTVISQPDIAGYLKDLAVGEIWGIGPNTARFLNKHGIVTAGQFTHRPFEWVEQYLSKPYQEIWKELNGQLVYEITTESKRTYASISKTRTFTPASTESGFVFSQLSKNVENAFIKVRRHDLAAREIYVYLKTQAFRYAGMRIRLNRATSFPNEVMPLVHEVFDKLFQPGVEYRATGAVLNELQTDDAIQMNLFENRLKIDDQERMYAGMDKLSARYGKHAVFLGSSLEANRVSQHQNYRGTIPEAKKRREGQLHKRKFMNLPLLVGNVS